MKLVTDLVYIIYYQTCAFYWTCHKLQLMIGTAIQYRHIQSYETFTTRQTKNCKLLLLRRNVKNVHEGEGCLNTYLSFCAWALFLKYVAYENTMLFFETCVYFNFFTPFIATHTIYQPQATNSLSATSTPQPPHACAPLLTPTHVIIVKNPFYVIEYFLFLQQCPGSGYPDHAGIQMIFTTYTS